MNKPAFNFWLIFVVGIVAFGWMIAELVRAFFEAPPGLAAVALDGVIQHKVGELMVGIPFVAVLALSNLWPPERTRLLIKRTRFVMIAGGVLNVLAWYTLGDKFLAGSFLRIWCLVIFVFGLAGPSALTWMAGKMKMVERPV
jgi:hypothetical protein